MQNKTVGRSWRKRLQMTAGSLLLVSGLLGGLLSMSPAYADQKDPVLATLFDQLLDADSAAVAAELEARIWQVWLQAPDEESAELLLATTNSMGQNDLREALINSTELVEQYPDYAEGWNKRATIYYLMGNRDDSVADIHETLRLEPRHFGAISGLGLIFMQAGNLEAALDAFEQVLVISPQSINARRSVEQVKSEMGSDI